MNELCNLLSQTHLSTEITSIDDITKMMNQVNLNSDVDIDDITELFNNMQISNDEIIEIANKSNNLSDFCKLMISIISQRHGQRCYQMKIDILPTIY